MLDNRISCRECRQCNRKGKRSITRYSKHCDENYVHKVTEAGKGIIAKFIDVKNKFFEKRVEYADTGGIKDLKTKGFRKSWFFR